MPRLPFRSLLPLLALVFALAPVRVLAQAAAPPVALPPGVSLYGDVNHDGRVTALDAVAVLAYVVGGPTPGGYRMLPNGDANGDGQVSAMDALVIAASAMGRDMSRFPVGQDVEVTPLDPDGPSRATAPAGSSLALLAGDGQKGFAGDSLKGALQVTLRDAGNNPVPAVTVTWTVLAGGGALRAGTSKTGATGIATNRWLMGAAGSQTVRASIAGVGQVDFTATAVDPTTSTIAIRSGDGQTGTAGDTLPRVVSVLVKDAGNNVIPGVSIAWTVLTGGGSVPAARTATSATGVASSRWVLGSTPGAQTLKAQIPGGPSVTFTATSRTGASVTVTKLSDDLYGIAGDSLGMGGWVEVLDGASNPVSTTITWTPQDGGAVSLARSSTNSVGRANSRWLLGPGLGVQHLGATMDGGPTVTFSTTAVSADSVVLTRGGDDQAAIGGTELLMYLDVKDPAGNPISGYVAYHPLTGGSPTVAGRMITGTGITGPADRVDGRAPLRWVLGTPRGYQTFQTSVAGGTRAVTFTALSTLLAGDSLTQVGGSASDTVSQAIDTPPSVRVADAAGNVVPNYPVVFNVTAGGGSIGNGVVTGSTVTVKTNGSGVAALTSWTLGATPGANTLHVSAGARSLDVNATGVAASTAPQITSISPATLVPGATATITGYNFNPTPASNTVSIGGRTAAVTGGSATQLTVTVPCTASGSRPVNVTTGGIQGTDFAKPLQVAQRTVAVGGALVLTSSQESFCNELTSAGGPARYIVSVFSASTSPSSVSPFQFSADNGENGGAVQAVPGPAAPDVVTAPGASRVPDPDELAVQQRADERHFDLLEKNRAAYELGRAQFPGGNAPRGMQVNRDVVYGDPPATRQFRVSNISPPAGQTICSSFYVVNATRVYYNGKLAIYEDDATPAGLRSSDNASMATYYQQIGDQFNADMEPIIRNTFGDILRRDAETDNNGIEIALFTPRINNSFSGVAGFVVSCDQFPNNDTTTTPRAAGGPYTGLNSSGGTASFGASNLGEYFYAYQPTINGTGFGTVGTPDYWYRTIRSTFIHESKHVASMAARVANDAPTFEESWLEEGTARHAEEMWMRNAVDNQAWKSDIPFGSAANPINVYCDLRTTAAECTANPRRPSVNMLRHFNPMYTEMFGQNARLLSPFGPTASDNASYWYAVSWSLVRYAVDRYGASDAAFLGGLTQSTTAGVANLTGRAGVSIDQLLGGWALSLAADDHPLLGAAPSADIQFPTWNMRSIYAGLNTDPNASGFTLAYPLVPTQLGFGSFTPTAITTLRGGGMLWYEISGTQTAAQLLRLETNTGGLPSSTLRIAVTRIQ
jgi:hypothetical protein